MSNAKSRLTSNAILLGAVTGAVVGGLVRGGLTFYNLREGEVFGLIAALPSAGIGVLCGAIAGGTCRVLIGTLLGAFLSAGVFGLFVLPFAYLFSALDASAKVAEGSLPFLLQKGLAGAIAGAAGAFAGSRFVNFEPATDKVGQKPS